MPASWTRRTCLPITTYGDEVDPSELTPRERRRLERAKLAVHEYRRRMLELYARDEAQDDDGK